MYPAYIDPQRRMYGLGFICCSEKVRAMRSLLRQGYFEYIDFEDPCVFIFVTNKLSTIDVVRKNFPMPFVVGDSRIIYFLGKEKSLKGEYTIESEVEMNLVPRFVDPGFTLNPLRQLIVSEDQLEPEEKMCLLLLCDMKLSELLKSKEYKETEINLKRKIERKIERFYENSMELFHLKSRESKLKLVFCYKRTLKKILGILPQNPQGPVSAFLYLVEDLEKEMDFRRPITYFQPICSIRKIKVEFIIDETLKRRGMIKKKLEYYLNRKRNHLEVYTIRLKGEFEPTHDRQFQRLRYEMIVDFRWDSPDIFDLREFFDHFVECFEDGLEKTDKISFKRFKSKEPRELWMKKMFLAIETPDIFADTIIESLKKHHPQDVKYSKQKLLDKTAIMLALSYLEPEDYLGIGEGIFTLVEEKPSDIFTRIAIDWALDRNFSQSYEFMQRALCAFTADFLSLIRKDEYIKKNALDLISAYILPMEKNIGKRSIPKPKKKKTERTRYFEMIIKNIKKIKDNSSTKKNSPKKKLYFPHEEQKAEIQNSIRNLLLSIPKKRVPKKETEKMAQVLYKETEVALETESVAHAQYSQLETQLDVARALVESLKWQKKIGLFERGISIRNEARKLRTENYTEYAEKVRKANELIRQSTLHVVKDAGTFEDDLAILYTSMMRDVQRKFPEETRDWIWGTEY